MSVEDGEEELLVVVVVVAAAAVVRDGGDAVNISWLASSPAASQFSGHRWVFSLGSFPVRGLSFFEWHRFCFAASQQRLQVPTPQCPRCHLHQRNRSHYRGTMLQRFVQLFFAISFLILSRSRSLARLFTFLISAGLFLVAPPTNVSAAPSAAAAAAAALDDVGLDEGLVAAMSLYTPLLCFDIAIDCPRLFPFFLARILCRSACLRAAISALF